MQIIDNRMDADTPLCLLSQTHFPPRCVADALMRGGVLPLPIPLLIAPQSNTLEGSPGSDLPFLFEKAQK